tara:strand:- start:835 stop:1092 length:258 start_codon:yes stop_codon:yes gene_type:complete
MITLEVNNKCVTLKTIKNKNKMGNMSYCRFENTYRDLKECSNALENEGGVQGIEEEANEYEREYVKKLIELCRDITEEWEHELED